MIGQALTEKYLSWQDIIKLGTECQEPIFWAENPLIGVPMRYGQREFNAVIELDAAVYYGRPPIPTQKKIYAFNHHAYARTSPFLIHP
jgi:hypothetical protein